MVCAKKICPNQLLVFLIYYCISINNSYNNKNAREMAGKQVPLVSGWFKSNPRAPKYQISFVMMVSQLINCMAKFFLKPISNHPTMTPILFSKWWNFIAQQYRFNASSQVMQFFPYFNRIKCIQLRGKKLCVFLFSCCSEVIAGCQGFKYTITGWGNTTGRSGYNNSSWTFICSQA